MMLEKWHERSVDFVSKRISVGDYNYILEYAKGIIGKCPKELHKLYGNISIAHMKFSYNNFIHLFVNSDSNDAEYGYWLEAIGFEDSDIEEHFNDYIYDVIDSELTLIDMLLLECAADRVSFTISEYARKYLNDT